MKSIQSPIVLLRWLEDGLHHCSYQSWKPKHSWCQSKFDKCVWGALLQPVCHHDCDKHSTIWIEASCFPFVSVICSHFLNLPMKYRAWKMWKNVFYIPKHLICQLFHPSTSVNFLWCHCFHSTTMVIKHLYKKKKRKKEYQEFFSCTITVSEPMGANRDFFLTESCHSLPCGNYCVEPDCRYHQRLPLIPESFL